MNEFVNIIIIYYVFRVIIAFLGVWWHGDKSDETDR